MNTLEIWLLAIGLAMDCLAVSIASGILLKKFRWEPMLTMATAFGLFQGGMTLIGWMAATNFSGLIESVDHWIAFSLLLFLGIKMIIEDRKEEEDKKPFNPANLKVILTLAIATSIDAMAVGISFAFLGTDTIQTMLSPVIIIGFVSLLMSALGLMLGIYYGCRKHMHVELWGGIILVGIGCKILIEHLFIIH